MNNIVEVKLCSYRMYEPLKLLITGTLTNTTKELIRSCFGERAQLTGQAVGCRVMADNHGACHVIVNLLDHLHQGIFTEFVYGLAVLDIFEWIVDRSGQNSGRHGRPIGRAGYNQVR